MVEIPQHIENILEVAASIIDDSDSVCHADL